jgi:hypothetical protein
MCNPFSINLLPADLRLRQLPQRQHLLLRQHQLLHLLLP